MLTEGGAPPGTEAAAAPLNLNRDEVVALRRDGLRSKPLFYEFNREALSLYFNIDGTFNKAG